MIPLHKLTLADQAWMQPIVLAEHTHSADFCFGNLFIWDEEYDQRVAEYGGRIIVNARAETAPFFVYPIGSGELAPVLTEIRRCTDEQCIPFTLTGLTEEHRAALEKAAPGHFRFIPMEPYYDYVYLTDKLADLSGKKLHGKRNHIHRFVERHPDWHYEPMQPEHFDACRDLLARWCAEHEANGGETVASERAAIERAFRYYEALKLEGGVLFTGGKLSAFTIGEPCASDTYLVHFEKADAETEGAYPMINREFARQVRTHHPEAIYINREDDMGLEPLRRSKRSYYPEFQVIKYTAEWIGE